jgi:hypothetical protein
MMIRSALSICLVLAASVVAAAQAPTAPQEVHDLAARATPADYVAQAKVGKYTIAADFTGHGIPNAESALNSEDYVAVEVAIFGPANERLVITASEFSLKINGKKEALPSQPWGLVAKNIKDPEWVPPDAEEKSKGGGSGLSTGGGGNRDSGNLPPVTPKPPIELLRNWQQRVRRAAIAEGDRALPQAGLLFFQYRGKAEGIRTVELLYDGPAGKASLMLQQ